MATNSSTTNVPAAADDVIITNAGINTVALDVHPTIASLMIGGASGTQTLTNAGVKMTLNGASAINTNGVLGFGSGTLAGGLLTIESRSIWGAGNWCGAVFIAPGGTLHLVGNMDEGLYGSVTN